MKKNLSITFPVGQWRTIRFLCGCGLISEINRLNIDAIEGRQHGDQCARTMTQSFLAFDEQYRKGIGEPLVFESKS